ncbi:MAG: hypothetical protein F6K42_22385, partial [Leptolyngbya sp. SIO1D8]|nr:hypothetical protein [Leptolyngbya sp. SIO1D8]
MDINNMTSYLQARFGDQLQVNPPDAWQVETDEFRLLVLLSADQSWLRLLAPLVPVQ